MPFAANLSTMFGEHPFPDRFAAAALEGFEAVEFQFPYEFRPAELAARRMATGVEVVLFNLPPGDFAAGERGLACLPGREAEFREGARRAVRLAGLLGTGRLHCLAGIPPADLAPARAERLYLRNVAGAAKLAEDEGIELLVEPINPHDMPGYFLADFGRALDLIARMGETGTPPGLLFDVYHCARIHGPASVTGWIERCRTVTGHYQIAGVPGRHEPDLGDLPLDAILEAIEDATPALWIGCEYVPRGRTADGLGWLRRRGAI